MLRICSLLQRTFTPAVRAWTEIPSVQVTCTPDRETAYEVTINGQQYKQQVFTFWSKTWVNQYSVDVSFTVPDEVPEGTRIVNMDNQDITTITTEATGDGYAGKFKVLYPLESVEGKTGSVQLSFSTTSTNTLFFTQFAKK